MKFLGVTLLKYCTFEWRGKVRAGWLLYDKYVVDMEAYSHGDLPSSMMEFLANAERNQRVAAQLHSQLQFLDLSQRLEHVIPVSDVRFLAPLPRPSSVRDFYAFESHVKTARAKRGLDMVPEWYDYPVFYFSNHQAIIGPDDVVSIPPGCGWFDFELEMACVIGKQGSDIPAKKAESFIFGYCIMNDWSARDVQREEVKVGLGPAKGKDFATSLGPFIVTPDELEDLRVGDRYHLAMRASVNGTLLSDGNYRDIYFPFPALIERASNGVTLYPGDVIGTGTVGTGCILELGTDVHRWLLPGDVVELTIDRLGTLRNTVCSERAL